MNLTLVNITLIIGVLFFIGIPIACICFRNSDNNYHKVKEDDLIQNV